MMASAATTCLIFFLTFVLFGSQTSQTPTSLELSLCEDHTPVLSKAVLVKCNPMRTKLNQGNGMDDAQVHLKSAPDSNVEVDFQIPTQAIKKRRSLNDLALNKRQSNSKSVENSHYQGDLQFIVDSGLLDYSQLIKNSHPSFSSTGIKNRTSLRHRVSKNDNFETESNFLFSRSVKRNSSSGDNPLFQLSKRRSMYSQDSHVTEVKLSFKKYEKGKESALNVSRSVLKDSLLQSGYTSRRKRKNKNDFSGPQYSTLELENIHIVEKNRKRSEVQIKSGWNRFENGTLSRKPQMLSTHSNGLHNREEQVTPDINPDHSISFGNSDLRQHATTQTQFAESMTRDLMKDTIERLKPSPTLVGAGQHEQNELTKTKKSRDKLTKTSGESGRVYSTWRQEMSSSQTPLTERGVKLSLRLMSISSRSLVQSSGATDTSPGNSVEITNDESPVERTGAVTPTNADLKTKVIPECICNVTSATGSQARMHISVSFYSSAQSAEQDFSCPRLHFVYDGKTRQALGCYEDDRSKMASYVFPVLRLHSLGIYLAPQNVSYLSRNLVINITSDDWLVTTCAGYHKDVAANGTYSNETSAHVTGSDYDGKDNDSEISLVAIVVCLSLAFLLACVIGLLFYLNRIGKLPTGDNRRRRGPVPYLVTRLSHFLSYRRRQQADSNQQRFANMVESRNPPRRPPRKRPPLPDPVRLSELQNRAITISHETSIRYPSSQPGIYFKAGISDGKTSKRPRTEQSLEAEAKDDYESVASGSEPAPPIRNKPPKLRLITVPEIPPRNTRGRKAARLSCETDDNNLLGLISDTAGLESVDQQSENRNNARLVSDELNFDCQRDSQEDAYSWALKEKEDLKTNEKKNRLMSRFIRATRSMFKISRPEVVERPNIYIIEDKVREDVTKTAAFSTNELNEEIGTSGQPPASFAKRIIPPLDIAEASRPADKQAQVHSRAQVGSHNHYDVAKLCRGDDSPSGQTLSYESGFFVDDIEYVDAENLHEADYKSVYEWANTDDSYLNEESNQLFKKKKMSSRSDEGKKRPPNPRVMSNSDRKINIKDHNIIESKVEKEVCRVKSRVLPDRIGRTLTMDSRDVVFRGRFITDYPSDNEDDGLEYTQSDMDILNTSYSEPDEPTFCKKSHAMYNSTSSESELATDETRRKVEAKGDQRNVDGTRQSSNDNMEITDERHNVHMSSILKSQKKKSLLSENEQRKMKAPHNSSSRGKKGVNSTTPVLDIDASAKSEREVQSQQLLVIRGHYQVPKVKKVVNETDHDQSNNSLLMPVHQQRNTVSAHSKVGSDNTRRGDLENRTGEKVDNEEQFRRKANINESSNDVQRRQPPIKHPSLPRPHSMPLAVASIDINFFGHGDAVTMTTVTTTNSGFASKPIPAKRRVLSVGSANPRRPEVEEEDKVLGQYLDRNTVKKPSETQENVKFSGPLSAL